MAKYSSSTSLLLLAIRLTSAESFSPQTKSELHMAAADCLGGCLNWNMNGTEDSQCLEWHDGTSFANDCRGHHSVTTYDVSSVTKFTFLFGYTTSFNEGISYWDVSNGIDFEGMFFNALEFNQPLSSWDVSNAKVISSMFEGTINFRQIMCSSKWQFAKDSKAVSSHKAFEGSRGGIFCCAQGKYYRQAKRKCSTCPVGFFQDEMFKNPDECRACRAGTYSDRAGLVTESACLECSGGRYSDEGEGQVSIGVCKSCAVGRYSQSGEGQVSARVCRACEPGRYGDVEALASECTPCLGGRYSDEGEAQTDVSTCKACRVNTWMTPGSEGQNHSSSCRECPFGRWTNPGEVAEQCNFNYFLGLVPGIVLTLCVGGMFSLHLFKKKLLNLVSCRRSANKDSSGGNKIEMDELHRRRMRDRVRVRPKPMRTVALMKQAKKKKKKKMKIMKEKNKSPENKIDRPAAIFEERFVSEVV